MYSNVSVRGWPLTFKILNYRTVQVVIADVVQREGGSKRSAALATIETSLCYELRYRAANYSDPGNLFTRYKAWEGGGASQAGYI